MLPAEKITSNPFDVKNLLSGIDDSPHGTFVESLMELYLQTPILSIADSIDKSLINEETRIWLNKIIPSHNENMTMEDFLNQIFSYGNLISTDKRNFQS
jgi:hypothetical protein